MKKKVGLVVMGCALVAAGTLAIWVWPQKLVMAQGQSQPTPIAQDEKCQVRGNISVCAYKFNDGVRCLFAGKDSTSGQSSAVSCVLVSQAQVPSAPSSLQVTAP